MNDTTLATKTIRGIGWAGISQGLKILLQFIITAILARLLSPNDYGLLAMITVFTSFVAVFKDFGLTAALIQKKDITEEHLSSSFWLNIFTGAVLSLLLIALSPLISKFYGNNRLTLLISVLSSVFFISSFGIVQTALFTKAMNFKYIAIIETSTVFISGLAAIFLAYSGFGVWTLIWQQILFASLNILLLWFFSNWKPKFIFNWQKIKELLGFGLNLTGATFLNYFNRNLDNLLIGKFLGAVSLGYYNLAYRLLLFPLANISQVIGRVMFPSLSVIQDDKEKVKNTYIKATKMIATITFPLMIGLFIVAPQFIRVILGHQWIKVILLIQILSFVGLIQSLITTIGWIYQSQGRTDIMFRWNIFTTIVVIIAFIIGLKWKIEGVTITYAIATFLLAYPSFSIPFKLIDLKVLYFIKQFKTIFLSTTGMGIAVYILRLFLEEKGISDLIILLTTVSAGVISYTILLYFIDKKHIKEILNVVNRLKR